jgi:catechol 2,3-dioxygenase-like lactoylglutathione lyase family enzyme
MVKHLDHLNMSVADLEATTAFYQGLFGFETVEAGVWRGKPWRILKAGEALLCLYQFDRNAPDASDAHRLSHFALRITDSEAFKARAAELGVPINYGGKVEWPYSDAYYVNDPTGYEIEVVHWHDDEVRFSA